MDFIKLVKPYITFEEMQDDFKEIFESGMFTKGQHVAGLSHEMTAYIGCSSTYLTTSATTALWVCLKLLDIKPGDEVIVSDFSFPASVNVIEDLGAIPVFADVCIETFNMQPNELENKITSKTKAVMFVDALGNPSGITKIAEICKAHHIPLIEDAACAIGSSENGIKCGAIADLTCFSFHPRKIVNTGEGGAIATINDSYVQSLPYLLNHGALGMKGIGLDFVSYGYNFRLSEIQAAMGRKQIVKLPQIIAHRNEIRKEYIQRLSPYGFVAQKFNDNVVSNAQSIVFRVPAKIDRNKLVANLKEKGIETTLGTYCLSACTYYHNKYNNIQPIAHYLENHTITLPCFIGLDVERVCNEIVNSI
jgi:dTDP-4-amino-4,6-dideoxygalactose transaminase